ncbi:MAG: hypothetical protein AUJ18_01780 [Candidatus Hydrogenedentes bacterium CG1_02_42_14]|nr:MAG: hypothetical protein AUJ18_01780 [Candidatus Hydrogenedentes bacterium CG1_02_42_14]
MNLSKSPKSIGQDAVVTPLKYGVNASNRIEESITQELITQELKTQELKTHAEPESFSVMRTNLSSRHQDKLDARAELDALIPKKAHAGPDQPGRAAGGIRFFSLTKLLMLFMIAFSFGLGGSAFASPPPGTWITNTAQIDYSYSPTAASTGRAYSNSADTQVMFNDTEPPIFISSTINPIVATNGGCTVRITLNIFDTSGVSDAYLRLGVMDMYDTTSTYDNGLAGDTTASDSLWNALVYISPMTLGDTYRIRVTAYDIFGNIGETYITLQVIDTSSSWTTIRSLGWNLINDVRVAGNALSILGDAVDEISQVYFEYRNWSGGNWMPCAVGSWSDHNPDTTGPNWGIYWNMDYLPDDTYLIKATAYDSGGVPDLSPGFLRVVKDSKDSWINEWTDTNEGIHVRRQLFNNLLSDTTIVIDKTSLSVEPSALVGVDSVWLRVTSYNTPPPDAPIPSENTGLFKQGDGSFRRFEREDGATTFTDSILISLPYIDEGRVGDEEALSLYYYDTTLGEWVKVPDARVDKDNDRIWANINHFTVFGAFRAVPLNLSGFTVYPNPFKPNDGDPTTGADYIPGAANTGITFEGLPIYSKIRIYTPLGASVRDLIVSSGNLVQWDAKNNRGDRVASGVYIFIVTTPSGEKITGKMVIIR